MMKFIIIPMIVIVALFLFGLFYDNKTFDTVNSAMDMNMQSNYNSSAVNGTFTENGEEKSLSTDENEYGFAMNETQGVMAIVIAVSVISSLIGIRVLGSGLSEMTVKILYNTIFFYGIWALFSTFALEWILIIPLGWIVYAVLTGTLSFGIIKQINK